MNVTVFDAPAASVMLSKPFNDRGGARADAGSVKYSCGIYKPG